MKEGEGVSQRTYMGGLWTWIMVWGLTMKVGGGLGKGGKRGKSEKTVISNTAEDILILCS